MFSMRSSTALTWVIHFSEAVQDERMFLFPSVSVWSSPTHIVSHEVYTQSCSTSLQRDCSSPTWTLGDERLRAQSNIEVNDHYNIAYHTAKFILAIQTPVYTLEFSLTCVRFIPIILNAVSTILLVD
jgi:hypothetical protein